MKINTNLILDDKQKVMAIDIYKRKFNELKKCKFGVNVEATLYLMEQIQDMRTLFQRNSMEIQHVFSNL